MGSRSFSFVVGGLGFEFCVFVAGWRHALRREWPIIIIIIITMGSQSQWPHLGGRDGRMLVGRGLGGGGISGLGCWGLEVEGLVCEPVYRLGVAWFGRLVCYFVLYRLTMVGRWVVARSVSAAGCGMCAKLGSI